MVLPSLIDVAAGLGGQIQVQVLTATHSPLVLASVEPVFNEAQDRLFRFDLRDGQVAFESGPWSPQGDVVGWLTSDLFDLRQARSREAEEAIEAAEAYIRGERDKLPGGLRTRGDVEKRLRAVLPRPGPLLAALDR